MKTKKGKTSKSRGKMSKTSKMIDELLGSVGAKTTAKTYLQRGYKNGARSEAYIVASEIIGRRYCINPEPIRKWYEEKYL